MYVSLCATAWLSLYFHSHPAILITNLLFRVFSLQAKENLGALGWSLSTAEVAVLDAAAKKVPKQLIQNSFQSR